MIGEYVENVQNFLRINDTVRTVRVEPERAAGRLWLDPLAHLNPSLTPCDTIDDLV